MINYPRVLNVNLNSHTKWASYSSAPNVLTSGTPTEVEIETVRVIKDASGNVLVDGDDVTIVKDMKVKGSSNTLKVGTKVRGIRLVDGPGDHDIEAKVDGFGPMNLKSSIVRKA